MKIERLITMANNIGDFFNAESDKTLAAEGVKQHITRSWEPRMRRAIIEYAKTDGSALNPIVKVAIAGLAPV